MVGRPADPQHPVTAWQKRRKPSPAHKPLAQAPHPEASEPQAHHPQPKIRKTKKQQSEEIG